MRKKGMVIIGLIFIITVMLGYMLLSKETIERRIISGNVYKSSTEKASEVIEFSINPKDYIEYKGKELGKRRLLMEKYDTKVYLEPIKNQGEDLWVEWSFENNWWKKSGACFTYRDIIIENGKRLYSHANPNFEAIDQKGNRVNEDWGGGGSTYTYGFRIKKKAFDDCETIKVKLSDFNVVTYQISLK